MAMSSSSSPSLSSSSSLSSSRTTTTTASAVTAVAWNSGDELKAEGWNAYLRRSALGRRRAGILNEATYCEFRALIPAAASAGGGDTVKDGTGAAVTTAERITTTTTTTTTSAASSDFFSAFFPVSADSSSVAVAAASEAAAVATNRGDALLRRLVTEVSLCLCRQTTCRNMSFDPRTCLWQADVRSEGTEEVVVVGAGGGANVRDGRMDGSKREADGVEKKNNGGDGCLAATDVPLVIMSEESNGQRVEPYKFYIKVRIVEKGQEEIGGSGGQEKEKVAPLVSPRMSLDAATKNVVVDKNNDNDKTGSVVREKGVQELGLRVWDGSELSAYKSASENVSPLIRTSRSSDPSLAAGSDTEPGASASLLYRLQRQLRNWNVKRGQDGTRVVTSGSEFVEFVVAMQLIGKGPEEEILFATLTSAIKAALIRMELPARLPMGRRRRRLSSCVKDLSEANVGGGGVRGNDCDKEEPLGFHAEYELGDEITSGAFATVYKGIHRHTGRKCAIKVIGRSKLSIVEEASVLNEVILHASASDHCNVVTLLDFFEEQHNFYLVMELMGGDLFDHIKRPKKVRVATAADPKDDTVGEADAEKKKPKPPLRGYSELDARDLTKNLLLAIRHCHERNIAHCDLKPKNVMLVTEGDETQVKLADFGLSSRTTGPDSLTRLCGSPLYVAPEVILRRPYDLSADMWSVGVMAYLLLGGSTPFMGTTLAEIFPKITAGKFEFPPNHWDAVSSEAKDLIRSLLTLDPKKRLTAQEALDSPWIQMKSKDLAKRDLKRARESLRTFNRCVAKTASVESQELDEQQSSKGKSHHPFRLGNQISPFIAIHPSRFKSRQQTKVA